MSESKRPGLFSELKRRNVFRVGAAYVVVGWLLIEVSDTIFPRLGLPDWAVTLVIALLALGFPVALILSWAFELTPEGVQRTVSIDDIGARRPGAGPLDWVIALGILVVIGIFVVDRFGVGSGEQMSLQATAVEPEASRGTGDAGSIAVLAFTNMSPDPENAYFAEGISEEILNILADIEELHVASRTSAFSFRGSNTPIPEIAQALDVAHVLEGSVRKQGNRVRITAQLIRADTDGHVWSDTYDRELVDIFEVQEEIAQSITDALGEVLGTRQVSVTAPTSDLDAYERFLRGRARFHQRIEFAEGIEDLEFAVSQDPSFGQAWVYLAAANYVAPGYDADTFDYVAMRANANRAVQRARSLLPGDAMVRAIEAMLRADDADQVAALELASEAAAMRPQDSTPVLWYGLSLYVAGYVTEAVSVFERAVERDPLVGINHGSLAIAYLAAGREQEAEAHARRAGELGWIPGLWVYAIDLAGRDERERAVTVLREAFGESIRQRESIAPILAAILDPAGAGMLVERATWRTPEEFLVIGRAEEYLDLLAANAAAGRLYNHVGWLRMTWLPAFRDVREDPRFFEAARSIGLVELWEQRGYPDGCTRALDAAGDRLDCSGGDE